MWAKGRLWAFLLLIVVTLSLFIINGKWYDSQKSDNVYHEDIHAELEFVTLVGWVHSIRRSNPLFVANNSPLYSTHLAEFQSIVTQNITKLDPVCNVEIVDHLFTQFLPQIGINGIIEILDQQNGIAELFHYIGSFAFQQDADIADIIDITATFKAHGSPLHGAIWSALSNIKTNNHVSMSPHQVFQFAADLCSSFQQQKGQILENCLHGVGHGLAKFYDFDFIKAVELCDFFDNKDYGYTCASGVFMDIEKYVLENTWSPCDQTLFPAACFKFKRKEFLMFEPIQSACDTQTDVYHKLGCIWGMGTVKKNMCDYQWSNDTTLQDLMVAFCIHGGKTDAKVAAAKHSYLFATLEEKQKYCNHLKPEFVDVCLYDNENRFNSSFLDKFKTLSSKPSVWNGPESENRRIHMPTCK